MVQKTTRHWDAKFESKISALMMAQATQMAMTWQGYTSHLDVQHFPCSVELTIIAVNKPLPRIPRGYRWSTKHITSEVRYTDYLDQVDRVRTMHLTFDY